MLSVGLLTIHVVFQQQEMKAIFAETSAKEGSNINEAVATLTR